MAARARVAAILSKLSENPAKKARAFVVLLLMVAVFVWIPGSARGGDSVSVKTIKATDADNGHALTIAKGVTLVVSLAATPGTGFGWSVSGVNRKVLKEVGKPEMIPGSHPMPGAPATQVLRFKAIGAGSTVLKLTYARPWEHGVAPARAFELRVMVR